MGNSSLPTPSEGMLCVFLVNTALFLSMIKGILWPILQIAGIHLSSSSSLDSMELFMDNEGTWELASYAKAAKKYIAEFRCNNPTIRFDILSRAAINPSMTTLSAGVSSSQNLRLTSCPAAIYFIKRVWKQRTLLAKVSRLY